MLDVCIQNAWNLHFHSTMAGGDGKICIFISESFKMTIVRELENQQTEFHLDIGLLYNHKS